MPVNLKVELAEPLGSDTLVFSKIGDREIVCRVNPQANVTVGGALTLHADMNAMHLFDVKSGAALT